MGCASSAPVEATTVSLDAGRRISQALDEADLLWKEGDQQAAMATILEAQAEHGPLLIGADATTFPVAINVKLGTYRKAMGDIHGALKLFTSACKMTVDYLQKHRDGTYIMIMRYSESAVSAAHCRLELLDEAVKREQLRRNTAERSKLQAGPNGPSDGLAPDVNPLQAESVLLADEATVTPQPLVVDVSTDDDFGAPDSSSKGDEKDLPRDRKRKYHTDAVEKLLLDCVQTIDRFHSHRSEMMVGPLRLLGELYERLGLFDEAVKIVRRLSGVFLVKYGHSHPAYEATRDWIARLEDQKERQVAERAVTSIISTCKMRAARVKFSRRVGRDPDGPPLTPSPPDSEGDEPSLLLPRPTEAALAAAYVHVATVPDNVDTDLELVRKLQSVPKHKGGGDGWLTEEVRPPRENVDSQSFDMISNDGSPAAASPARSTAFTIVPAQNATRSPSLLPLAKRSATDLAGSGRDHQQGLAGGPARVRGLWAITPAADDVLAADGF